MSSVLARATVYLEGDASKLEDMMSKSEKRMKNLGENLDKIGKSMSLKVTAPIVALGTLAVHKFAEQQDALARTKALIQATGGAAGVTAAHFHDLAEQLSVNTKFSADMTEKGAGVLLTFTSIRNEVGKGNDVFDRAVKVSQDLASLFGNDLQSASTQLGRALQDPEQGMIMLRREGIIFSAQQEQQIKDLYEHNNVLGAQKLILQLVEGRVKGLADAMAKTPIGQMTKMWGRLKGAMTPFGAIIFAALHPLIGLVNSTSDALKNLNDGFKVALVVIAGMAAAIGPLLIGISSAMKLFTKLGALFGVGGWAAFGWAALIIAAVASVIYIGYELVKNWTAVKLQLASVWALIKELFWGGVDGVLAAVQWLVHKFREGVDAFAKAPGKIGEIWQKIAGPVDEADDAVANFRKHMGEIGDSRIVKSGEVISKLTNKLHDELVHAGDQAETTGKQLDKAGKREPTWMGPATQALSTLDKALGTAKIKASVLGDQFDESGAEANAYSSAVDALANAYVPLDTVLDKTHGSLHDMIIKMQELQNQAVMDALAKSLKDNQRQAAALGDQFDLVAADAASYSTAVSALVQNHTKLGTTLGNTGRTLQQLEDQMLQLDRMAIMEQLHKSLKNTDLEVAVLGTQFDGTGAKVQQYQDTITQLIAKHTKLTDVVDKTGTTFQQVLDQAQQANAEDIYKHLSVALADVNEQADILGATYDATTGRVDAYSTAVQDAIARHLDLNTIIPGTTLKLSDLMVKMNQLSEVSQITNRAKQAFTDLGDAIVDFAFTGKMQFGDFVRSILSDITKIIIQFYILKALTKSGLFGGGGSGDLLSKIVSISPFAEGGFLAGGAIGLVGERGPELISGGRNGVSITPMPAAAAAGSSGDREGPMIVQVSVNAIDQRGVADFFDKNESLVANAMIRARKKSNALRRALGGR